MAKSANNDKPELEVDESAPVRKVETKPIIPKDVDPTQYVTVRNGFQGILVYRSARTGELFRWSEFGAEQEMELRELRNAKNSAKAFFINNWFMFDDDWIIDYLGVRQYYKNAIPIDRFDEFFKLTPAKMKEAISKLSRGQKRSLGYRATELMKSGDVDFTMKTIKMLEESLGISLIED